MVTVCNLNTLKRSYLERLEAEGIDVTPLTEFDYRKCSKSSSALRSDLNLTRITLEGGQSAKDLILECYFMGRLCSYQDFTSVVTRFGICHAFNSDRSTASMSLSPGPRFGLDLVLNIEQEDYGYSLGEDAGVSVVVHSQEEPGEPTDAGVTVAPGHAARVALTERNIYDDSSTAVCRPSDSANFVFLPETYQYSLSACLADAFFTAVAENCGCIDSSVLARPSSGSYSTLPDCGVGDLCCVTDVFLTAPESNCQSACQYTTYSKTVSYSAFPAEYVINGSYRDFYNGSREKATQNLLSVNVFFQGFTVEEQVTRDAYSLAALLSDIGGQLGLFLGASVVSVLEFALWLMDEWKDCCIGVNDKKLAHWLRRRVLQCRRWEREAKAQLEALEQEMFSHSSSQQQDEPSQPQ